MRWQVALLLATGVLTLAEGPTTIVELQQFRRTSSIHVQSAFGKDSAATLVNLNPAINAWFLLNVDGSDWHLENPKPHEAQILLDEKFPSGLVIVEGNFSSRRICRSEEHTSEIQSLRHIAC